MKRISIFFALTLSLLTADLYAQRRGGVIVSTRPAHAVVTRQAHVPYAGMPHWGASVTVVPQGAVSMRYHNNAYYGHNGVYYARRAPGYAVVRPAWGLHVNILPVGYRTIPLGGRNYYYYYGTFYGPGNGGYTVVQPPVGAVVDSLPEGYTVENINGTEYYVFDGVTYAEVDAPEYPGGVGYEVVRI